MPDEVGGFVVPVGEGAVGHDQVQFDAGLFGVPVARGHHSIDELVGHDLALAAVVVGVAVGGHRGPVQGPVDADAFFDRQQRGHVGHAVGGGADGDPPIGDGFAGAVGGAVGVEAVGPAARLQRGVVIAPPGELVGDGGVDPGVVFLAEVGGLPGDEGGPPFAAVAVFQGAQHQRPFVDEGVGAADV